MATGASVARAVSSAQLSSSMTGSATLGARRSEYAGLATSFSNLSLSKLTVMPAERYTGPVASKYAYPNVHGERPSEVAREGSREQRRPCFHADKDLLPLSSNRFCVHMVSP
jgi:hypothetical protein